MVAFVRGTVTALLLLANIWNFALALSDIARFGCSYYYGTSAFDHLPRVCHPLIPPYQQWAAFKSLEAQVSRHSQQVYSLTVMLHKLDDVLGVALGTDCDLARIPQADVIESLTTSDKPVTWNAYISSVFTSQTNHYLPTVVLDSPPNTGECWLFAGSRGHVAILLAHPARITAMSVVLPPFDELWDEVYQAPKLIHVWGHSIDPLSAECSESAPKRAVSDFKSSSGGVPAKLKVNKDLISLARFEYSITSPYSRQLFPSQIDHACANVTFNFVVVEVLTNWGAEKTCLYHVGIHGKRP